VPNEVIGVLAHETGHIAGGTPVARFCARSWPTRPHNRSVALILGVGAMVAAARSNSPGAGQAGQLAALQAPQAIIQNRLLAYVRTQERLGRPRRREISQTPLTNRRRECMTRFKRFVRPAPVSRPSTSIPISKSPSDAGPNACRRLCRRSRRRAPYWDKKEFARPCNSATI